MQHTSAAIVDEGLRPLRDMMSEFVLVGGASIGLWIDQPAAPPARPTNDIDLVVLVRTRPEYHRVGERLRERGFSEDSTSRVLCRWRSTDGTIIDVMPVEADVLGFGNEWYGDAFDAAQALTLPSSAVLRVATVPYLIATKFDAFDSPHRTDGGDYLVSADMHDIMALLDGYTRFEAAIESTHERVVEAVTQRMRRLTSSQIEAAILNYVPSDATGAQRRRRILDRIHWTVDR